MRSPIEILRRVYHDIVVGRSKIKIVSTSDNQTITEPPIFIIGAYRSGTTMLRYIVDSHSRICCPPESEFILPLSSLHTDVRIRNSLLSLGYDNDHLILKLRSFINSFFSAYATGVNKARWADKTPAYVDCLDFLRTVFPEAQFLMLYRHGLDQAHSMTRGGTFQRDVFKDYCEEGEDYRVGASRYWNEKISLMLDFENRFPEQCHRVLYESLCESPQEIVSELFQFLNEAHEPETLEYANFQHTVGKEDGRAMAAKQVKQASRHHHEWSKELQDQCFDVARANLEKVGYQCPAS